MQFTTNEKLINNVWIKECGPVYCTLSISEALSEKKETNADFKKGTFKCFLQNKCEDLLEMKRNINASIFSHNQRNTNAFQNKSNKVLRLWFHDT